MNKPNDRYKWKRFVGYFSFSFLFDVAAAAACPLFLFWFLLAHFAPLFVVHFYLLNGRFSISTCTCAFNVNTLSWVLPFFQLSTFVHSYVRWLVGWFIRVCDSTKWLLYALRCETYWIGSFIVHYSRCEFELPSNFRK